VAEGRNLSLDHVKEIAKGRIWSGEDARKFGLVGELGGLNKAISIAKAEAKMSLADPINIKQHPHAKNLFEQLLNLSSKESSAMTMVLSKINRFISVFDAPALKMPMEPEYIK
jgi:protease IV